MKITSKDCVKWLITNLAPNTSEKDWKRISKTKNNSNIVRIFENRKTGNQIAVYECNGVLTNKYNPIVTANVYYAICKGDPNMGPELFLAVSDISCFDNEHRQSDWTPKGTIEELICLGFNAYECMEGMIEFEPVPTVDELKTKLATSSFFKLSKKFEDFMISFDNPDSSVIPIAVK